MIADVNGGIHYEGKRKKTVVSQYPGIIYDDIIDWLLFGRWQYCLNLKQPFLFSGSPGKRTGIVGILSDYSCHRRDWRLSVAY